VGLDLASDLYSMDVTKVSDGRISRIIIDLQDIDKT
jgi:hypothetical protein